MLRVAIARLPAPTAGAEPVLPRWLCKSEQQRWAQLRPEGRAAFVASRALLREMLQAATGIAAATWDVSTEAGTAPVAHASAWGGRIQVSLSHRLGWVAAAVADTPVGVDIECDRAPRSNAAERAALMLAPDELAEWQALAGDAREAALLARWTAKEAWYKSRAPQAAPWDFRRVRARACTSADARANVRTWRAQPVHVALCCDDARALAGVRCDGLAGVGEDALWQVAAVDAPH